MSLQVVDSDGLVIIPSSKADALARWVVLAVFSILIFGTPLIDVVAPAPAIKLMGAERKRDIRLKRAANLWDGSLFRLWEHDMRLRSRIRRWATDQYGWMLYQWFGHAQRALVVGDDGWLFLRSRIEISGDLKTAYLARRAGASIAATQRRLAGLGLETVFVPIPRKAALLGDFLPSNLDARSDMDRAIIDDLRQRGLPSVDLWRAFADGLEEPPYHLLGSHWTDEAQFVAAKAVSVQSGRVVPEKQRSTTVTRSDSSQNGADTDLLRFGGMERRSHLPKAADRRSLTVVDHRGRKIQWAPVVEPGKLVVIGTSFTGGRQFAGLISHFIGDPVFKMAQSGEYPGLMLARFLGGGEWKDRTEEVVVEIPCHHLIHDPVARLVAPLFALPPAKPLLRHFSVDSELYLDGNGVEAASSKGRGIAIVKSGKLAHSGDGVVGVRVRGRVKQNVVLHLAPVGGESVKVMWKPGTGQVVLPLISTNPLAGVIWFAITPTSADLSAGSISIKSIDIVSEVRPQPRVVLSTGKPTQTEDGWEIWIDVPEAELSPTALLELDLDTKGKFARDLAVEVYPSGDDEPLTAEWWDLKRDALVVVSLARFAGHMVKQIRISGSGPPPNKLLKRAGLLTGE